MRRILLVVTLGVLVISGHPPGGVSGSKAGSGSVLVPPPELSAASEPERFSKETLFDIINGDADLYLKAGFVQLDTRRFLLKADPRQWLDLFGMVCR